jgi:purine nucleoside permease
MRTTVAAAAAFLLAGLATAPVLAAGNETTIPVKVVVVTMFEDGNDLGDGPGELQNWVERYPLPEVLPFPAGQRQLRYNRDREVLAVVTGVGTARAAASIMALGLDPRFDLSHAYWLVAGIAGANPDKAPLASAFWAEWVVDGDLAFEIDAREIPPDWSTGYVPLFGTEPYQQPRPTTEYGPFYRLNPRTVEWAYHLTRDLQLPDPAGLRAWRSNYAGHAGAILTPRVMKGDTLSASTFWHGDRLNDWATHWVSYWTNGEGTFFTSAMEDSGTLASLTRLGNAGRIDMDRVLILRATSNFTMQHPGIGAAESLAGEGLSYSAFLPSLVAAYLVGRVVVDEVVDHWDVYGPKAPGD